MTTYQLPERAELERQLKTQESHYADFHDFRGQMGRWRNVVRRQNPEAIPPALALQQDGIDWQSPAPQKYIQDHIGILMMNEPRMDVMTYGEGQKYRDNERDQLLTKFTWWHDVVNKARRVEARVHEGMVRDGVKVEWLRPKPISEHMTAPNYFQNTVLDGNFWLENFDADGPDVHWYKYTVELVDSNIKNKAGEKYSIDAYGKSCWLGADEPHDFATIKDKKVDVYVRDANDLAGKLCPVEGCDHVQRVISIFCCPTGESFKDNAETVESYPSPFPGSSFFIVGAHTFQTDRDPHWIYQPHLMAPVYVIQAWLNMLITWWAVLAKEESSDAGLYLNKSNAQPANEPQGNAEGNDDTVRLPDTAAGEMPVFNGSIDRIPKVTSAHLSQLISQFTDMLKEYAPNRFQMGVNYTELSNGTASSNLSALQQSGILYSPMLDAMSSFMNKWDAYTDHQIKYNDIFNPGTKYWANVSDDPNIASYRTTIKRGEQVYLDASKCLPHDIIISISNKTYAEKQADWYLANSQYQSGVLTSEDLIKAAGVFDVIGQMERLFKDGVRRSLQPLMTRMFDLKLVREATIRTGTDFGQAFQQVAPQEPRGEQNGTPSTQAANTARQMNPTVSLPPMSTPAGGGT